MRIATAEIKYSTDANEYAHLFTVAGTNNKWYYNKSRLGRTHVLFRLTFCRNAYKNVHTGNNVRMCEYIISSMCQNNTDMIQLRNVTGNEDFVVLAKINADYSIDIYAKANWKPTTPTTNMSLLCDIVGGDMGESCIFPHAYAKPILIENTDGYLQSYLQNVPVYATITPQNSFTWNTNSRTNGKIQVNQKDGTCEICAKVSGTFRGSTVAEAVKIGIVTDYVPSASETVIAHAVLTNKTVIPLQCVIGNTGNIIVYGLTSALEAEGAVIDFLLINAKYRYKTM